MKQRPETLFAGQIPLGCLLYGNTPTIEDYLVLDLFPERLNATSAAIKTFTESELLAISKEKLYLESSLFESPKLYVVRDVTDKFLVIASINSHMCYNRSSKKPRIPGLLFTFDIKKTINNTLFSSILHQFFYEKDLVLINSCIFLMHKKDAQNTLLHSGQSFTNLSSYYSND